MTLLPFRRGTAAIDWCEGNYSISPVIAEFVNTISNVLFLVFPPLLTTLFKQYAESFNRGVYLIWTLYLIVGVSSAYFHATLSLVGQLLDELAILWLLMAGLGLWLPRRYIPAILKNDRKIFQLAMVGVCGIGTLLSCINPAINAFVLMSSVFPIAMFLGIELLRCKNRRVQHLGMRCLIVGFLALVCWINDRLFCEIWSSVNFPYLHGAWHILIAIAAYGGCVLFAYFDACSEIPEKLPELKFWPSDGFELGVPYVTLRNSHPLSSHTC